MEKESHGDSMGKESHGAQKDDRGTWTKELRPHCAFLGHIIKKFPLVL